MYNLEIYPAESKHYPPFEQMMPAFYHFNLHSQQTDVNYLVSCQNGATEGDFIVRKCVPWLNRSTDY